jgi:DNA polymerase-1
LDAAAPAKPDGTTWNWNSHQQIRQSLALAGCAVENTTDETLASAAHPLAELLRRYRASQKKASTYGLNWLKNVAEDGRVYAGWRQLGAKTGRMASGKPNLQNLPRDPAYRQCFLAPPGRVLIKADYSQIELRIAAKVSGDEAMIEAFRRGDDLHTLTARLLTGRKKVSKQERQLAKPVNFGLIYGLGADSLMRKARSEYQVELTKEQAEAYRHAFFTRYSGIARWHQQLRRERCHQMLGRGEAQTRTLTGRRVLVKREFWHGGRANYIVQGTGGDGIKLALALLWERRQERADAFPVLVIHDEIVVEAEEGQADESAEWLKRTMLDAMTPLLEPVPVEVEVKIARTWGGD